jgi:hypothetical protein
LDQLFIGMSWWGYGLMFGILFSGYMMLRTSIEEKRAEQDLIEKQGSIYIEKIREEQNKKKSDTA